MKFKILKTEDNTQGLQLAKVSLNPNYAKEWHIYLDDFYVLTMNGKLLRDTLYRKGMFEGKIKDRYFLLLKHAESFYPVDIMEMTSSNNVPEYLEEQWVILDSQGNEKVEAQSFKYLNLTKNSCIYSSEGEYYNIETGECYGSGNTMESENFLFVDQRLNRGKNKRGVLMVNKKDGSSELIN